MSLFLHNHIQDYKYVCPLVMFDATVLQTMSFSVWNDGDIGFGWFLVTAKITDYIDHRRYSWWSFIQAEVS